MLGISDLALRASMARFQEGLAETARSKNDALQAELGELER
jgi:hypothetical protein